MKNTLETAEKSRLKSKESNVMASDVMRDLIITVSQKINTATSTGEYEIEFKKVDLSPNVIASFLQHLQKLGYEANYDCITSYFSISWLGEE